MLSGAACGLLLLLGGLAVALAMNAFPRLTLLVLRAVPLLVALFATYKTLVVVVSNVPLCFNTCGLGTLACAVLFSSTSLNPRSSHRPAVRPLCSLPVSGIVGLNYSLVPLLLGDYVEPFLAIVYYDIESHVPFDHATRATRVARFPLAIASTSTLPCFSMYCHHRREPAVSKLLPQGTLLHEHAAVYRHARIHLQHAEYLAAKPSSLVC